MAGVLAILSIMACKPLPCTLALAAFAIGALAQTAPTRPRILGVAHIAVRTDNLDAARKFYGEQLGYAEAFHLDKPEGGLKLIPPHRPRCRCGARSR